MKQYPVVAFANAMVGRDFVWGQNDCNTATLKFLDMIMRGHPDYTSITGDVVGKCDSATSAIRFYNKFRLDWEGFLSDFCDKNPESPRFQLGDIILVPMKGMVGSHICIGGKSLSVDPEFGSVLVPTVKLLEIDKVNIFRPKL